jgi:hypothetical protein
MKARPENWKEAVRQAGFVRVAGEDLSAHLPSDAALWRHFSESWNALEPDTFMADGGRYRGRRFAVATLQGDTLVPAPHQPHFQTLQNNRLNGGVARWFSPIDADIVQHDITTGIIALCRRVFSLDETAEPGATWRTELHQFRIEASRSTPGSPTPEGMHRDGVDWVFVMLVARHNADSGITDICDAAGASLGAFTLTRAMDAVFLDDHRVLHGVTPITVSAGHEAAHRDVLVITFTQIAARE